MIKQDLDHVFNARSVAIYGVSTKGVMRWIGGEVYLNSILNCGFKGRIYPINPKGGEILGLKVYANIRDVPEPVDYVISCAPVSSAVQLVKDCIDKEVKVVHFFTSGFSETGSPEGRQLEQEISSLVRRNGMRVIGPNCLGVYCPSAGLAFAPDFVNESGPVGLIGQSGGNCTYVIRQGMKKGIRFSKVISYGNACDVDESDLLEYLARDEDTKVILAYIEGVKDGRRFGQLLKETNKVKPVVVLKGGVAEAGARAVASHTGALAGSDEVWDGLLRQAGAIRVHSLEELVDMAVTFTYLPMPLGKRAAVLGFGGGVTVLASDDCNEAGLEIPDSPAEVQDKLKSHLRGSVIGVSLNNPVDLSAEGLHPDVLYNCGRTLIDSDNVDLLLVHLSLDTMLVPFFMAETKIRLPIQEPEGGRNNPLNSIVKIHEDSAKPMAVVMGSVAFAESYQIMLECQQLFCEAGLPVYQSLSSAAMAISRFMDYHKYRAEVLETS